MQIGHVCQVSSAKEMHAAEKLCHRSGYVVFDASDWQIIPAENLVAAFQVGTLQQALLAFDML